MSFCYKLDLGNPTSLDFFPVGIQQMVVSYNTAKAIVYDIETGQNVVSLDSAVTYGNKVTKCWYFIWFTDCL